MLVSFELTMPNVGSWNGKWTGADSKYYVIRNISTRYLNKNPHFKKLLDKGNDSWYYNFGDGWVANVSAELVNSSTAKIRRKKSKCFCGYDWMIDSIVFYGTIKNSVHA